MITEKAVIRYEAVCDVCGEFVGETATASEAYSNISVHFGHAYAMELAEGGVHVDAVRENRRYAHWVDQGPGTTTKK